MAICTRSDGTVFRQWQEGGEKKRKYYGKGSDALAAARYADKPRRDKAIANTLKKHLSMLGENENFVNMVDSFVRKHVGGFTEKEDFVAKELSFLLKGLGVDARLEVNTPAGLIDILTESEIIEVKYHQEWKNALGQVLAYGAFNDTQHKRIHLFNKVNIKNVLKINKNSIVNICHACLKFGVKVSFREHESYEFFDGDEPENLVHPTYIPPYHQ